MLKRPDFSEMQMGEPIWASCKCYYQRCIYSKSLDETVVFTDRTTFLDEYKDMLSKTENEEEEILKEIIEEVERRKKRSHNSKMYSDVIREDYEPLYKDFFHGQSGELSVVKRKAVKIKDDVFTVPILDSDTCNKILEELHRFEKYNFPTSSPHITYKVKGFDLQELGMDNLVRILKDRVEVLTRKLYPGLIGSSPLDSCRAFTVSYEVDPEDGQQETGTSGLDTHFDNAEVTLNLCLTSSHEGGELFLLDTNGQGDLTVQHRQGFGLLHLGSALHGALPLQSGTRTNLIMWLRSSFLRNQKCPMCGQLPDLEPVMHGQGDGFTLPHEFQTR